MAFDGITVAALVQELKNTLTDGRINKIAQPETDELLLTIKTVNGIKVPLMKGLEGKGKTDGGAVAVAAAVSLLGGIFMKGSGVVYEPGTNFTVEVKNDTDLQCTPENLAKAMDPTIPRGQVIHVPVK